MGFLIGALVLDTLGYDFGPKDVFWFDGEVELAVRVVPPRPGWLTGALFWHPVDREDTLVLTVYEPLKPTRPGSPILEETLRVSGEGWAYFPLDTLRIIPRDGLWLSVRYVSPSGGTPAPVDSGPAQVRHGSFFQRGGSWEEAWRYGLDMDFNWALRAEFLSDSPGVDVAAEGVLLSPCWTSPGEPVPQGIFVKNYSDLPITLKVKALLLDSLQNPVSVDSQEIYLSRYGYAGSSDTVELTLTPGGEGVYQVLGIVSYPSDTVPENDTARKPLVVSRLPVFDFDTLDPADWPSAGWRLYTGYEAWIQWQEKPVGSRAWAKDEGPASFITAPVALKPGAQLAFLAAAGPSFTKTGSRFFTLGSDTFDITEFDEREWTWLRFDLGLAQAETLSLNFRDTFDQEFYIDCLAFLGADTVMTAGETPSPRARSLKLVGLTPSPFGRGFFGSTPPMADSSLRRGLNPGP